MPAFETKVALPCSPERAFDFITRPANMRAIAPPDVDMVIVQAPEVLELGSRFIFKVQAYGQPIQFEHEVIHFDRPTGLRERMVKGPLPRWEHEYVFEAVGDGTVLLINRINFDPPGGLLGMLVTADRMLEQMEVGYAHRGAALQKALSQ